MRCAKAREARGAGLTHPQNLRHEGQLVGGLLDLLARRFAGP
jgi:hypothetical protein